MNAISVFEILKIGIGPSSSHTMGPWKAALCFVEGIKKNQILHQVVEIKIDLYGSLALTGKGHGTDKAVMLGLSGYAPETIPVEKVSEVVATVDSKLQLCLDEEHEISFDPNKHISFHYTESLDYHPNGLRFTAYHSSGECLLSETYFSTGGGFIEKEGAEVSEAELELPFPIRSADDIKKYCHHLGQPIAWIVRLNEMTWNSPFDFENKMLGIWKEMLACIHRGCHTGGTLPGGLNVSRRASAMHHKLLDTSEDFDTPELWMDHIRNTNFDFDKTLKFISCFAIASNEENANFGRVVTAPTNGASGVIPAVMMYYICFSQAKNVSEKDIIDFLCIAGEVGCLFKKGATISAAMGGCQAEIGVSSAMAAAALASGLGGSVDQTLMAAEIAMEHHLGLTCDPINGLVQIPCIERNSMGAIKAINAALMALESDPKLSKVSLDHVIKTMWETACDMNSKYKETSQGGLATQVAVSVSEC